jgi:uncharacterized membrane protein
MTGSADASEERHGASFRAVLSPHRSLPPLGFVLVMGAIAASSFIAGLWFALAGAWPVLAFFGLDVLLVYVAFRANYRSGRAMEIVEISRHRLTLTRLDPDGREHERAEFDPYWVRIGLTDLPDGRNQLSLASHGRRVLLGHFLTDEERETLATAMREAIRSVGARR